MTPSPGIEPGPHWWEASALTTAPSLLKWATHFRERAFTMSRGTSSNREMLRDIEEKLDLDSTAVFRSRKLDKEQ